MKVVQRHIKHHVNRDGIIQRPVDHNPATSIDCFSCCCKLQRPLLGIQLLSKLLAQLWITEKSSALVVWDCTTLISTGILTVKNSRTFLLRTRAQSVSLPYKFLTVKSFIEKLRLTSNWLSYRFIFKKVPFTNVNLRFLDAFQNIHIFYQKCIIDSSQDT